MQSYSLTQLSKETKTSLNAASILSAIIKTDLANEVEYVSTSGSGEIKKFVQLSDSGLRYGENRATIHEFKTEPRFYAKTFPELLASIILQLDAEVKAL